MLNMLTVETGSYCDPSGMIRSATVAYTHNQRDAEQEADNGSLYYRQLQPFRYQWTAPRDPRYVNGGGQTGISTVYCYSRFDFLILINRWNMSNWMYAPISN